MILQEGTQLRKGLKKYSCYIIVFLLILGLLVITGWQFDIESIKRPISGLVAMNPLTAVCFIITALAYTAHINKRENIQRVSYFLVAILLSACLFHFLMSFGVHTQRIDLILYKSAIARDEQFSLSSNMAPNTSLSFILSGLIIALLGNKNQNSIIAVQIMALVIFFLAYFSLLGYTFRVHEFYGLLHYLPMAIHTAFGFFLFALSVLFYTNDSGWVKEITSPYSGGYISRYFIPAILIVTTLCGYIVVWFYWKVDWSVELGYALLCTTLIIVFIFILWYNVFQLNKIDMYRHQAQKEIGLAYTLLTSTINSYDDVMIFSIDRSYKLINFNDAFVAGMELAYGTQVKMGASIWDIVKGDDNRNIVRLSIERAFLGDNHRIEEILGQNQRDWFEARYTPIVKDDSILGITVLSTNISERKKAEDQIKSLNKELESFTYTVAHDLRAPLRIINGYISIIEEDCEEMLADDCSNHFKVIADNAQKMGKLIDDLLNFSKLGRTELNRSAVNMNPLLDEIIKEQLELVSNKERITFNLKNIEDLYCDRRMMRQVWYNLISNALKYSENKEQCIIEINSEKSRDEVIYYIKDNGAGFDMRYADRLFGVFQRLHKPTEFEGTGVGLAIVSRVVSRHGGKVWAEAEVGKGATFYMKLPYLKKLI